MMAVWGLQAPEQKTSKNDKSTVKGIEDTASSKADLTAPCDPFLHKQLCTRSLLAEQREAISLAPRLQPGG
jgi:hypothetical protein